MQKFLGNRKLKHQFAIVFFVMGIAFFINVVFSVVNILTINKTFSKELSDSIEIQTAYNNAIVAFDNINFDITNICETTNPDIAKLSSDISKNKDILTSAVKIIKTSSFYNSSPDLSLKMDRIIDDYKIYMTKLASFDFKSSSEKKYAFYNNNLVTIQMIKTASDDFYDNLVKVINSDLQVNVNDADKNAKISIFAGILLVILSFVLAFNLLRSINRRFKEIFSYSEKIGRGEILSGNKSILKDEISEVGNNIIETANIIEKFMDIIKVSIKDVSGGNFNYIEPDKIFGGIYLEFIGLLNDFIRIRKNQSERIAEDLDKIVQGDFSYEIPQFPGGMGKISDKFVVVQNKLKNIIDSTEFYKEGIKNSNIDFDSIPPLSGDWAKIQKSYVDIINLYEEPLIDIMHVFENISKGKFNAKITSEYQGNFKVIKNNVNLTISNVEECIKEISQILRSISNNNLNVTTSNIYFGDFVEIKKSLDLTLTTFNTTVERIQGQSNNFKSICFFNFNAK